MKNVRTVIVLIVILIICTAVYFFLGFYNVSATKPHMDVTELILHVVSERSIKRNSANIQNPFDTNDKELYIKGFREYDEMCVQCHGWSGIEPSNTGKGLYPTPPLFPEEELDEFSVEEIFWVTKNGIKMSGMPAYGPTHDDKTIWSIAIFLNSSREMTKEGYKGLRDQNSGNHQNHDH